MARSSRRNASAERISNRKLVEAAIQSTPDLKKDDLTNLANIFLRKTSGMRKKHVRKYLSQIEKQ